MISEETVQAGYHHHLAENRLRKTKLTGLRTNYIVYIYQEIYF